MGFLKNIFGEKQSAASLKKKALVFVDFEYWYISLDNLYHRKPDIKAFRDELSDRYDIIDIAFFGDFSNPSLRLQIPDIRTVTNNIIETQNASDKIEKDFTDFIMLDHIYQSTISASQQPDAYVIFTGDGHFSSVVSFLVTKCRREVGIYAIKDSASAQLLSCATYSHLYPDTTGLEKYYSEMIIEKLRALCDRSRKKKAHPTFWATVEAVAKYYHVDREEVANSLRALISKGYVYQAKENVNGDLVKVLKLNWSLLRRDGLIKE